MLVKIKSAELQFGIHALLNNVNLSINSNDKIALIGRNGMGKSTLLKVISGQQQLDSGSIEYASGIKVGVLEQEFNINTQESIFDIVASGLGSKGQLIKQYHELSLKAVDGNADILEQMQVVQEKIEVAEAWDVNNQVETVITKLNLDLDANFNSLSGGMKRRVLLAKALVQQPDLLLLDEPTNHLDIESIEWLESFLAKWKTSVLFISHDRSFVKKLSTRIIELDRGELSDWPGSYDDFLNKKEEYLHAQELANTKFDKKLAEEEKWIRQGIKARRTRNEGRVRALKQMRQERALRQDRIGNIAAKAQEAEHSGKKVIEAQNITKIYDGRTIINNFSTLLMRGDKVAIIGPNGSGKTTLINILLGNIQPDTGMVNHGTKLEIAYFDQMRCDLDSSLSVRDNVSGGSDSVTINGKSKHIIGYLQDFLFTPERANAPITMLSGGEKNRLLLAKLFTKPSNLLVLDEPTNDLDIETLELLEELLVNYTGTILLISHDREFINNIVTSTIVFEGQGEVSEYVGNYEDWIRQRSSKKSVGNNTQLAKKSLNSLKSESNQGIQKVEPKQKNASNLSNQEQRELFNLPKTIEKLEKQQQEWQNKTLEHGFYQQEQNKIDQVLNKLNKIEQELEVSYARWDELESK